jgi:hypothetical protein
MLRGERIQIFAPEPAPAAEEFDGTPRPIVCACGVWYPRAAGRYHRARRCRGAPAWGVISLVCWSVNHC